MVIRHSIKELLLKKYCYEADEIHSSWVCSQRGFWLLTLTIYFAGDGTTEYEY